MLSHVFCCKFDQDVFKNSCSGKSLNNIKNRGWQQSINCCVNSYCLMLIKLFGWSFTKPLNKLKYRTNIFWKIFYSAIYLKLVSAIFYQIFIFHQVIALQKLWKMLFISSKKLFSFPRYWTFCISVFPSFSLCQPLL